MLIIKMPMFHLVVTDLKNVNFFCNAFLNLTFLSLLQFTLSSSPSP
jgi:hypothetical protein